MVRRASIGYIGRMAGTPEGVTRAAAQRVGVSEAEYRARRAGGEKWCHECRGWHHVTAFMVDRSRGDGLSAICAEARNRRAREHYTPKPKRSRRGCRFATPRDGDKKQARGRVNSLIAVGLLPPPRDVACVDCGHSGSDRRHEYDHYLGYAVEHHEHVQAVCSKCHSARTRQRGEWRRHGRHKH